MYKVKISNGYEYDPSYPYIGNNKDIAIAVATAYIAQGKSVSILEGEEMGKPKK